MSEKQKQKTGAARLSILSNLFLIIIKVVAGVLSGSVSIISEAIHSGMDLMAAIIAFFSVKVSSNPPDRKHPYGHGKIENISGVVEAMLILVAAVWIIYEAVHKLMKPEPVGSLGIGFAVMLMSGLVNFFVSRKLYRVAKKTDSLALEADALHLKTDVYTSLGVALGLALLWLTGLHWLDPVVAILVALLILFESFSLLKKAYRPLLDTNLPENELNIVKTAIEKHLKPGMSFHQLRTRRSGHFKYVDLHLEVPGETTVAVSHRICDDIEAEIRRELEDTEVHIHIEPLIRLDLPGLTKA